MVELEDFKYGGTNITAFRLVNPDLGLVQDVVKDWRRGEARFGGPLGMMQGVPSGRGAPPSASSMPFQKGKIKTLRVSLRGFLRKTEKNIFENTKFQGVHCSINSHFAF